MARAGDNRIEESFPAEKCILHTWDISDFHLAARAHGSQVPGVYDDLLPGSQLIFHHMAVKLREGRAMSGKLLQDEALPAEEAGGNSFVKVHRQTDACLGSQKRAFLKNHIIARRNLECLDGAGKTGCKSDHPFAAFGSVDILEKGIPGKKPSERFACSAYGGCLHKHIGGHPRHGAFLCDHFFFRFQFADNNRKWFALD